MSFIDPEAGAHVEDEKIMSQLALLQEMHDQVFSVVHSQYHVDTELINE